MKITGKKRLDWLDECGALVDVPKDDPISYRVSGVV